jgi:hypothetical protein
MQRRMTLQYATTMDRRVRVSWKEGAEPGDAVMAASAISGGRESREE